MLTITKRDKIFTLIALPVAIIAFYAWAFGAELHDTCSAYNERIEQLGTVDELESELALINSQIRKAQAELAGLKNNNAPVVSNKTIENACEICSKNNCRGGAFCSNLGARLDAFRALLAEHDIKLLASSRIATSDSDATSMGLLNNYSDYQRWNMSIEATYPALTDLFKECANEKYPFVIDSIGMVRSPSDNKQKLWTIQIML